VGGRRRGETEEGDGPIEDSGRRSLRIRCCCFAFGCLEAVESSVPDFK
jgi:hypothetical protein